MAQNPTLGKKQDKQKQGIWHLFMILVSFFFIETPDSYKT